MKIIIASSFLPSSPRFTRAELKRKPYTKKPGLGVKGGGETREGESFPSSPLLDPPPPPLHRRDRITY